MYTQRYKQRLSHLTGWEGHSINTLIRAMSVIYWKSADGGKCVYNCCRAGGCSAVTPTPTHPPPRAQFLGGSHLQEGWLSRQEHLHSDLTGSFQTPELFSQPRWEWSLQMVRGKEAVHHGSSIWITTRSLNSDLWDLLVPKRGRRSNCVGS